MDVHLWRVMLTSPFVLWFVATILLFTQKGGDYGRRHGSNFVYSAPLQLLLFSLLQTVSFAWIACLLWNTPDRWFMVTAMSLLALVFLWASQPYILQVDCDQKTYYLADGWPLIQRRRRGSLADVERFRMIYTKGCIFLVVVWKGRGPRTTRLGSYQKKVQAEAAAAEVQEAWGIKVPVVTG